MNEPEILLDALRFAAISPPTDYVTHQGWVIIAFHNAFWQLLHAPNFEEGLVDTVMRGGDTDTNAAICGALLGAALGAKAIPEEWKRKVLNCRPSAKDKTVRHPRPEKYWPVDALELAGKLMG